MKRILCCKIILCLFGILPHPCSSQTNLLLNGGFEDVNVCTEYTAECGVEAWFYLKDVKAQMLNNDVTSPLTGNNSFGIFFNWLGYTDFSPLIGTILPCSLQKGKAYTFRGIVSAKLNPKLLFTAGICFGPKFYVPKRAFSKEMHPDSIIHISRLSNSKFYQLEYQFTATGTEKYLTFGTYIKEDTTGAKKRLTGVQTVSVVLDNFQLIPVDANETVCPAYEGNKKIIYEYNFRHREMDYSLFGRGDLNIVFDEPEADLITTIKQPEIPKFIQTDTLKLGDVLFDFNKAILKPGAIKLLTSYFINANSSGNIDSIYIDGHTDSIGTDKRNLELSGQRCQSVKDWLILNSIITDANSSMHAFGKQRPVASNQTAAGRALNRRVEIIIFRRRD